MEFINVHTSLYSWSVELIREKFDQVLKTREKKLRMNINSQGGSVDAGNVVVDAMDEFRDKGGEIHLHYSGLGASYAAFLAPFADIVTASPLARFMLHSASYADREDPSDDEKRLMQDFNNKMQQALKSRGVSADLLTRIFENHEDVWLTAQQAAEEKIIDEVKSFEINLDVSKQNTTLVSELVARGDVNELHDFYLTKMKTKETAETKVDDQKPNPEAKPLKTSDQPDLEARISKIEDAYKAEKEKNIELQAKIESQELREKSLIAKDRDISEDLLKKLSIDDVRELASKMAEIKKEDKPTGDSPKATVEDLVERLNAGLNGGSKSDSDKEEVEIGSEKWGELSAEQKEKALKAHVEKQEKESHITQGE